MSGPNPPEPDYGAHSAGPPSDDTRAAAGEIPEEIEAYAHAYSAPESEQFVSGPYVPVDPRLYDYDNYETFDDGYGDEIGPPRWPWVVGTAVIVAAIALVVSVALLFTRIEATDHLAVPATSVTTTPATTTSTPPTHDEITTTTAPAPPPPSSEEPPPPPETTAEPVPEETSSPEPTAVAPAPATTPPSQTTSAQTTTSTPARPRQITYTITGTKAPFDQITITYIDNSGQRRTQRNAYIPWSMTLTPISQSEIGSVEAVSLLRLSKLNCSITASDGTVLSANNNDAPQTSC